MPSFLETSVEIARESGALLAAYFERRVAFELKGEYDLVTEADRASERLVVERLRSHFPSHAIVAEEGGGHESSSGYRWYVDPLDGTTNFAHSFPVFNVTMALEASGCAGSHRLSQPQTAPEHQHSFLPPARYANAWSPPVRFGCHRPGLCSL